MSAIRGGVLISAISYVCMAVGVAQTMLLSRALGPEGVGQLTVIRQLFLLGAQLASLGLPMAMIHAINTNQISPSNGLKAVLNACSILSVLAISAIAALLFFGESIFKVTTPIVYISMVISIPTVILRAVYYNFHTAQLNSKNMALISFLPAILALVTYLVMWKFFTVTVESALLIEALTLGLFSYVLSRQLTSVPMERSAAANASDWGVILRNLPFGLQLITIDILILVNGFALLMLLRWLSKDFGSVGYFSRGLSLSTLAVVSVQALQRYIYAHWSKSRGDERVSQVEKTINISIMIVFVIGAIVVLCARPLTIFLYGPAFLPAVQVTRITLVGTGVYLIVQLLQSFFNASGDAVYNIFILGSGLIFTAVSGWILIPRWEVIGCSYSFLLGCSAMAIISVSIGCAKFGLNWRAMLLPSPRLLLDALQTLRNK